MSNGPTIGRYMCHTCKTVFTASIVPILADMGKGMPTARRLELYMDIVKDYFDPYWQGNQGITTKKFLEGIVEYIVWSFTRHKCHHKEILRRGQQVPAGYKTEPSITEAELTTYRSIKARKKIERPKED